MNAQKLNGWWGRLSDDTQRAAKLLALFGAAIIVAMQILRFTGEREVALQQIIDHDKKLQVLDTVRFKDMYHLTAVMDSAQRWSLCIYGADLSGTDGSACDLLLPESRRRLLQLDRARRVRQ